MAGPRRSHVFRPVTDGRMVPHRRAAPHPRPVTNLRDEATARTPLEHRLDDGVRGAGPSSQTTIDTEATP